MSTVYNLDLSRPKTGSRMMIRAPHAFDLDKDTHCEAIKAWIEHYFPGWKLAAIYRLAVPV